MIRGDECVLWRGNEIVVDAVADACREGLQGRAGKVGAPGGRQHLGVSEQFTDHRQPFAEGQCARGEGVAQAVEPELGAARFVDAGVGMMRVLDVAGGAGRRRRSGGAREWPGASG